MTRSYFLDYVTDWYELIEFCRDYDCDICEDIIDDDTLDEYVDSDISGTDYGWRRLRDFLSDIPADYNYYRCDGTFDYVGLDDGDFEDYKHRVLDWMDADSLWDAEDDDGGEDFPGESEDVLEESAASPVEEEDFSVSELMRMCSAELVAIRQVMTQRGVPNNDMLYAPLF